MEATDTTDTGTYDPDEDAGPETDPTEGMDEGEFDEGEFDGEGGTIADAADAANEDEPDDDDDDSEEIVQGTIPQLSLDIGGEEPTKSTVKVRGGSREVDGEFHKGDRVQFVVEGRVSELHLVDRVDDAGFVTSVERRHVVQMESIRVVGSVD